jgi:hypothetical protein
MPPCLVHPLTGVMAVPNSAMATTSINVTDMRSDDFLSYLFESAGMVKYDVEDLAKSAKRVADKVDMNFLIAWPASLEEYAKKLPRPRKEVHYARAYGKHEGLRISGNQGVLAQS